MKKMYVSYDFLNISPVRNDYYKHLYYSQTYSDSKFDHVLYLLCDIDLMTVPKEVRERLENAINFLETEDD